MTYQTLFYRMLLLLLPLLLAGQAQAGEAEQTIRDSITERVPGLTITGVREAPADGLYEVVTSSGEVFYATAGGEFLITGDLLQLTGQGVANITETGRTERRAEAMAAFGEEGLITYPAKGEQKAEIAVFTDIDCPYCRKLHDEMGRFNELGITVHYYGFPRSGPGTPSFAKYESVWCAEDSRAAMDAAKQGRSVPSKSCDNPVRAQFELGGQVGVTGTPAIVLESGEMVRGYVPADRLAEGLGLL
ncbi:MAG: DsbC family protein [Marinobacter sp.]|uniref:DsbC family protein n=1 Tax=Marinobacter sp. TaxID=50741 RepID=UPI00299DEC00|nr:DsbC family protein [Marinobacter sp.]MDX1635987.1 DsbC family protein [Marinobacter sp.]